VELRPRALDGFVALWLSKGKSFLLPDLPEDILHTVAASPGPFTAVQSSGEIYSNEEGRRKKEEFF
jgi:hypothetical protein